MKKLILFLLLLLFSYSFAQTFNPNTLSTTGTVFTSADDGTYTYIGGQFSSVGYSTGCGAKITTSSVLPNLSYAKVNGIIYTVVSDGSGGWYIGGSFSQVGTVSRNNIVHINSDGTVDATWNPNPDGFVFSLAVSGSDIYVGGDFTNIGGQARNFIAKLNNTNGNADATWNPNADGFVYTLVISGTDLYVGGSFTNIGGQARSQIAKLSTSGSGTADLTWNPNADMVVRAIAISGTDIYAGGDFTLIGGQSRNRIAKLNNTNGAADATWNPNANSTVFSIAVSGTDIYVGGGFTNIGGQARNRIAKLNNTNGNADLTWDPNSDIAVRTLAVDGTDIYVGGHFFNIGGQALTNIAKLNNTNGNADATWNPNADNAVFSIAVSGTDIYVGGGFTNIGLQNRNSIVRFNNSTGVLDNSWNPNTNFEVRTIVVSGPDIYVGGDFTNIGGQARNRIAKLNNTNGNADATWNPDANSTVYSIAVSGTDIYVGGNFTNIGGQARNRIAKLNNTNGNADLTWDPNSDMAVSTLAVDGTDIYVGGHFTNIGGQARNFIAKLNNTNGNADATWNPNADRFVSTLVISGTDLYVGGSFTNIGGQARSQIAKLSTSGSGTADLTWNPNANSTVFSIAVSGTDIYVGGGFTNIGGQSRNRIAKLNNTNGNAASWNPDANATVGSLSTTATTLNVGGGFTNINAIPQTSFASFTLAALPPAAPTLSTPSSTSLDIALNTTFTWNPSAGANYYQLEVDDDNLFSNPIVFSPAAGNYTTSPAASGLTNNTVYYWHVRASNDGGLTYGNWSSTFSFTTELGTPSLTAPASASVNQSTTPTFTWTLPGSSSGVTFDLQYYTGVGSFPGTTVSNVSSGYNGLTFNGNTLVTWRVLAKKTSFTTKTATPAFSFTTRPAPVLTAPASLAIAVSVTPTFTWTWPGAGTPTYTIEIAYDASFTNIVYGPVAAISPYVLPDINALTNSSIYYWRITATLPGPVTSSSIGKFTTITAAMPVLVSPAHLANITGNIIAFQWTMPSTGLFYKLEICALADNFSTLELGSGSLQNTNSISIPFSIGSPSATSLLAGTYKWRIKTYTSAGALISISGAWSFRIPGPPTAIPAYPINDQTVYSNSPQIYWYLNDYYYNSAVYYRVRYGTSTGSYGVGTSPTTTGQYVTLPNLTPGATIYYVVDANTKSDFSGTGTTSNEAFFNVFFSSSTLNAIPIFLSYPTGGTTVYSTNPTLYWFLGMQIPGVTYDVEYVLSTSPFANSASLGYSGISGNEAQLSGLTAGATYKWQIKLNGTSTTWYGPETFTIHSSANASSTNGPVIPTPTWPIAGTVVSTQSPTLTWSAFSTLPLDYQVIWSTSPILTSGVLTPTGSSSWLVTATHTLSALTPGVTYYWQVRSRLSSSPATVSNYSSVGQFTVAAGASPVVVLPANPIVGSAINSTAVTLSWIVPAKSTSLLKYDLEISKSKNFSNSKIINDLQEPSYQANNLDGNSIYYWRVKSKTLTGISSSYSYSGQFNILGATPVEGENEIPTAFALEQNYPNPFNPTTVISYSIVKSSFVSLKVYDMLGREVKTLVNQDMNAGKYNLNWNGDDNYGNKVSSGTYIYRITADKFVIAKKMILIK